MFKGELMCILAKLRGNVTLVSGNMNTEQEADLWREATSYWPWILHLLIFCLSVFFCLTLLLQNVVVKYVMKSWGLDPLRSWSCLGFFRNQAILCWCNCLTDAHSCPNATSKIFRLSICSAHEFSWVNFLTWPYTTHFIHTIQVVRYFIKKMLRSHWCFLTACPMGGLHVLLASHFWPNILETSTIVPVTKWYHWSGKVYRVVPSRYLWKSLFKLYINHWPGGRSPSHHSSSVGMVPVHQFSISLLPPPRRLLCFSC